MLKQMILWGATGGMVGAVISDKSSYDPSGGAALYGCGIGVVIAVALVWPIRYLEFSRRDGSI